MSYSKLDSPESIPLVFTEAWNRRDAPKLASLFDEDAEFINVTGLWWHNRQAIEKAHAYGLEKIFNNSTLSLLRTKVKYLAENIAVVQAKMKLKGQTPVGDVEQPGLRSNIFTFVVHKTDDCWSCASAQNTDIIPNMETYVRDEKGNLTPVDYRKNKEG
jgi:uncharacterized protein (TIGR02246 family)